MRGFGPLRDHAVSGRGHGPVGADPLHDAGQAVQAGNERRLAAAAAAATFTREICKTSEKLIHAFMQRRKYIREREKSTFQPKNSEILRF